MELHLTPEQEAHLHQIAEHEGKTPEELVVKAVLTLASDEAATYVILRERITEADKGIFIEQDEMDSRFRRMMGR